MKTIKILILLCIPPWLQAQPLTGEWEGIITQVEGGYSYEYGISMNLKQTGNLVTGTSKVWLLESPKVYAVMKLSGEYKNGSFTYRETQITHQENLGTYYWCYKAGKLSFTGSETQNKLDGPWWGTGSTATCPPGQIHLKIAVTPPPVEIVEKPQIIIDEGEEIVETGDSKPEEILVEEKADSAKTEDTNEGDDSPGKVNGRTVVVQGTVAVKQKEITIYVWDTDEIDGDRVTLYFNGEKVLTDYKLSKEKYALTLTLIPGQENLLMLYAENVGRIPPNTAAISWWEAGSFKTKLLHSDLNKSGSLSLKSN